MAKLRVYELARELNTASKALAEKLIAGGMTDKNYMSSLDEEEILRAKEIFSGAVAEVIEEKRVQPTVIRRRKKRKELHKIPEEEVKEELEIPKPKQPPEEVELKEEKVEIEEAPAGEEVHVIESRTEEKAPVHEKALEETAHPKEVAEEVKVKPKKAKKKRIDQPAKIIKPPKDIPKPVSKTDASIKKIDKKAPDYTQDKDTRRAKPVKDDPKTFRGKKKAPKKKSEKKEVSSLRRRKKEVYERSDLYENRSTTYREKKAARKSKHAVQSLQRTMVTVPKAIKRKIRVQESVTIADLAKAMGVKAANLLKRLMALGTMANINQSIDFNTAAIVADEIGFILELDTFQEGRFIAETEDRPEELIPRPPVVTIMGHVDHGKTSLLDYIRKSNIIGRESGGITQHIGAYYVETEGGNIVFLDTPGHEAFTAMRARGAKVTDIIVLVVAADDGMMPQTKEAVNHVQAAEIPLVIAVNKIDKPDADPEKVRRELAEAGLAPEEWGGETLFGDISAKTGEGVNELLALILLQSEMLELKCNPNKKARGTVIEANLDKSKGPVATVLVKDGTLKRGDHFISGEHYGRVRGMLDHRGRVMESGGPSVPVEIYGISGVPMAGDEFIVVQDERIAKQVIENRRVKKLKQDTGKKGLVTLDDLFDKIKEGKLKELNIILKADVQGSLEALADSLNKQNTEAVKIRILHSATGGISESDVMLAATSDAIIIGFNVRANPRVSEIAEQEKVNIRYYNVIYDTIKDIRAAMTGLLDPVYEEHIIGRADVKEIFRVPKIGAVAGCYVSNGYIERNADVRLLRDNIVVFDGKIASLRRFKEDVKEVQSGYECGIGLENFNDIKPGDVFEVYQMEELEAKL